MSPINIANPINIITRTLLLALNEHFGAVPYLSGGQRIEKKVRIKEYQHLDFYKNPLLHIEDAMADSENLGAAKLPSISVSLMGTPSTPGSMVDQSIGLPIVNDENTKKITLDSPPEYSDLLYHLEFLSDNFAVLRYFMARSITVFKRELAQIETADNCHDLDVLVWPQVTTDVANISNLHSASMEFIVRAVQFPAGKPLEYWVIKDRSVYPVGINQVATATVNNNDEFVLTVEP